MTHSDRKKTRDKRNMKNYRMEESFGQPQMYDGRDSESRPSNSRKTFTERESATQ